MADEVLDSNLQGFLLFKEASLPNINTMWDFRMLLTSSEKRLSELNRASRPDNESIQLEQAIIRGASRELMRLEKEVLYFDGL